MMNKQNLLIIVVMASLSGAALYAAEEKELAADLELTQTQEAGQENPEEKRIDLYKEGIHAFTRSAMFEKESPIIQAFKKLYQDSQPGLFDLARKWAREWAWGGAQPAADSRQAYPYPTFNFNLFKLKSWVEVNPNTLFFLTLDKKSKDKNGRLLLSAEPHTWLNNPAINNGNVRVISWEYQGSSHDNNAPGLDNITLLCRAEGKGTSRITLDNRAGEESQYWLDIRVE